MRILHIHAHPDDAEMFSAGTLALLAAKGHHITIVTMTAGDCGSNHHAPDEIAAIRRREAATAAAKIGAEYLCGEFKDLSIYEDDASRRRVTSLLRKTRPDLVITAPPIDYHCDHEATSKLVRDACFGAPAPNYSADGPVLKAIPHLYFTDPAEGTDRNSRRAPPHFVVDVSSTLAKKRDMLAAHVSQRLWLQEHHHMDNYIETMEAWSARVGKYAEFAYGEGFRHYRMHPYPATPLLEELLGDEVVRRLQLKRREGRLGGLAVSEAVAYNQAAEAKKPYTTKQGRYLAFIFHYTKIHGIAPAESDMQSYFQVSPPSVHQMVVTLEANGFIERVPGKARSIRLLVPEEELPKLG